FLQSQTGDYLHVVVEYDADSVELHYTSETATELIRTVEPAMNDLLEAFRAESARNTRLDSLFEFGGYYCSLHLFGGFVLLHFGQSDQRGIVCGYEPTAASHLTEFVTLLLPYLRRAGLDELDDEPSWT
ncbi:MAG: hypothetical protein ABEI76_02840, partial [Halobacteriales archaeon]